ncbi:glycoside hydrolase superfamily [Aspergillus fruticulosus]
MASGILRVDGDKVVDNNGNGVILRGAATGGWMNMENFITGYPAHVSQHRAAMLKADAKFFAGLGLNCIRIPFNYRHFEDGMNPRALKEGRFKHLDRYKDHQDRTVWLWEQIVARYKGNPWVARYNPLNEPCGPKHVRLPAFYERVEKAIRAVDPDHILWLDGNTFAIEWMGFDRVLPNCVYAMHDYASISFPTGPRYKGTPERKSYLERQFLRKAEFINQNNTPIWNGEFGLVYANESSSTDTKAASINQERYNLLGEQLRIYDKYKIHCQPFLDKKRVLMLDHWGGDSDAAVDAIDRVSPGAKEMYPTPWNTERHLLRGAFQTFLAASFADEFAGLFKGLYEKALEELARSFAFDECVQREGLNEILRGHASVRGN